MLFTGRISGLINTADHAGAIVVKQKHLNIEWCVQVCVKNLMLEL